MYRINEWMKLMEMPCLKLRADGRVGGRELVGEVKIAGI
jgi:hypothetical protein